MKIRSNNNSKFARRMIANIFYIMIALMLSIVIVNIVSAETTLEQDFASFGKTALGKLSGQSNSRGTGNDPIQGTGKLVDFYNRNQSLIDFFVMFTLFATVALVGLNKVGFGEGGNAMKGLALAVGAALALAALKAGYSPSFFVPFVKNFLFLIIFLIIFLVIKAMAREHTVVAFILALVITWVAFNVSNLVLEPGSNKLDMTNLFKGMAGTPTDTAEQRRLSNIEVKQIQDELDALYEEKGRLEGLINDGPYNSKFLVQEAMENENDKEKKANLKRLFNVMEKIEELEAKMQREMGKRFDYDKQSPTTPKVDLKISDDNYLICTIDPTTGKIFGAPENINKEVKYRFEFSVDGNVEKYYDVDYNKYRAAREAHYLNKEGTWKCKVYAYIDIYGKTPDQVTPGEATLDYLGQEFKNDKTAFEARRDIIKTERENIGIINDAVTALEGLEKRTYYNRNKNEIDKFINTGKIKVLVISKFKEAKDKKASVDALPSTTPAEQIEKIKQTVAMVELAKEALSNWESSKAIDMTLYNEIKAFIGKYASTADAVAPKPGEVSATGEVVKRELIVKTSTQTIDDSDDILGTTQKGSYTVAININPSNQQQTVVQGNQISFSVQIDSQVRNGFNIIVEQDIDGTKKILPNDDRKIEVSAQPVTQTFSYAAQTYFDTDRTLNIKVYDMNAGAKDDDTKIVDKSFRIKIQSSGVIDTSRLGLENIR